MHMSDKKLRCFIFFVSLACASVAGLAYMLGGGTPGLPSIWRVQFLSLLVASIGLSALILFFGYSSPATATLLLFRLGPLAVLALPEGARIDIMASLACAYVMEVIYYFRAPFNRIYAGAVVVSTTFLLFPAQAWGIALPRPSTADITFLWLFATLAAVLADRHRTWGEKSRVQDAQIRRLDEATLQLTSANKGFQHYADTIQAKSTAEERNRITREIHDTVGYTLINVMMMIEEVSLMAKTMPDLQRVLDRARDQAQSGLNETRRALRLLRATERRSVQTIEEIKRLVTAFEESTGVNVTVEYGNIPFSFGESVSEFIFHMLQEGMTNALCHGKATRIHILFWLQDAELIVNLHDNGGGSSAIHEGIGLAGMRERIGPLGGTLSVRGEPGGFQVTARIPRVQPEEPR
jgi:signal transduction histidine kinase